jgi:hypothetical protein
MASSFFLELPTVHWNSFTQNKVKLNSVNNKVKVNLSLSTHGGGADD